MSSSRVCRTRAPCAAVSLVAVALALMPLQHHAPTALAAGTGGGGMFGDVNISAILDSLSISYDKRVRPNYGGPPVEVGVTMYVLSISSVSEVLMVPTCRCGRAAGTCRAVTPSPHTHRAPRGMAPVVADCSAFYSSNYCCRVYDVDFTLDFYFRQFWTDPRLAYAKIPGVETLSVGSEFIRNIWVPDTFFVNEKQSYFHIATTSNEFIRIHYSGSITRSIRLTITASCPMNLQYFPMDSQLCHIEIESFGYTMRDIRYKWNEGSDSVGVSAEVSLPQFKVLGHRQRAFEISLSTGNYSRLACEIQFVRSMGYYMIQIYIPSGLIVIISWVSFWLNRNATPARVSLGVTTVLTMTTLMSSTNAALPKISYVKSIDVYLGTCFVMVFASLLEYATVGYMAKRIQMRKQRYMVIQKIAAEKKMQAEVASSQMLQDPHGSRSFSRQGHMQGRTSQIRYKGHESKGPPLPHHTKTGTLETTVNGGRTGDEEGATAHVLPPGKSLNKMLGITASDIDKYSRIVFPVCFICFNLMYWIIYLHVSDVVADDLVLLEKVK